LDASDRSELQTSPPTITSTQHEDFVIAEAIVAIEGDGSLTGLEWNQIPYVQVHSMISIVNASTLILRHP